MSFSSEVKNELVKKEYENYCCQKSLLYGLALFAKQFSFERMVFQSENRGIVKLYTGLLKTLCNVSGRAVASPSGKSYTVTLEDSAVCARLMTFFGHTADEKNLRVNHSNFSCPACENAFLAGAFLSCGSVSTPEKDYHLEFTVPFLNLSKSLVTLLQEMELEPKTGNRKGYHIIYFKDSGAIEDCLYLMGASASMFQMMNVKIVKEIRNSVNRRANCETANIEKTVNAAMPQIEAIVKIKKKKGLDALSPALREMAKVRLDNPELSLQELAEQFNPPLTKSGANHRLKRLMQIAAEL